MRPILLVLDPPDPETLSTRKLILESEKFNVMTAFTGAEALEIAERVPVNAIVLHERVQNGNSVQLAADLKRVRPDAPIWLVSPHPHEIPNVDKVLSSFEPLALVNLARNMFGNYVVKDEQNRQANPPPSKK
jgi:DNA-binding response OmpR family regulator